MQEIRDAVLDFRKSGKPVYAYLEYGGDRDYYLASAADKVFLMPSSPLDLTGVATYEVFLRGTLDKIGVYPDLHHIGDYKTAVEHVHREGLHAGAPEMDASLNRDLYDQIVRGIAEARKKTEAEVRALIDDGPFLPEDALRAGLIDDVAYEDQVMEKLRDARPGRDARHRRRRLRARQPRVARPEQGPRIAVIYAAGAITSGKSGYDPLNGADRSARTRSSSTSARRGRTRSLRAIVLRIDSPGGSAAASDAIWRELMIAKQRARRPADRRVDVRPRRLRRLLHRHAGPGHRRAAVDAHRLDRHLRRQVRHRRPLREARREHRLDQHRQARRDELAGAALQRRTS